MILTSPSISLLFQRATLFNVHIGEIRSKIVFLLFNFPHIFPYQYFLMCFLCLGSATDFYSSMYDSLQLRFNGLSCCLADGKPCKVSSHVLDLEI